MISKPDVIRKAYENGFKDVGFTAAEPFDSHREFLLRHQEEYGWLETGGLSLLQGSDPKSIMAEAKTIIVLMEVYFKMANPIYMDHTFEPDAPTIRNSCPDWCRNACIAACPTRALKGNSTIDPRRCISYLTYYGEGLTPRELREPMGLWVYGCDRCQNVCPRNAPWLAKDMPMNPKVAAMEPDFQLACLLHMDKTYYEAKIWPHMFYMSSDDIWRWQMNAARAMGNTRDEKYIDDLKHAGLENSDKKVQAMAAWALGRIGGTRAMAALEALQQNSSGIVLEEIHWAMTESLK